MNSNKEQTQSQFERIIYLFILFAPLVYLFILIILHFGVISKKAIGISQNIFFLMLIIFLFYCCGNIILTYFFFIPLARNVKIPEQRLLINFLILVCGATVTSVCGLILGIIWWSDTGVVPFCLVSPFIGFSLIHGYYLYRKYILPKKIE